MQVPGYKIDNLEMCHGDTVVLKLANGVTVHLSSNEGYLHLHFSGIDADKMVRVGRYGHPDGDIQLANNVDLKYSPRA